MSHTSTTICFAERQVVPMFILSPKVIQRLVRRHARHPCCIHRMTNEGQTGEQKLNVFSITAPLPPLRWGKTASAVAAARHVSSGGARSNPVPPHPGRMGRSMVHSPLEGDSFAVMNSGRVPGQALSLAGFIRSVAQTIWLVALSPSRLPDHRHTVDSDK